VNDELWLPLVDEPIGDIVARIQREYPELAVLAASPRRQLVFRTFASVRVGLILGELLLEDEEAPKGSNPAAWIGTLLRRGEVRARLEEAVRAVGREVASDPSLASGPEWPDEAARRRFREFARQSLTG
jgi:hypothetical protein